LGQLVTAGGDSSVLPATVGLRWILSVIVVGGLAFDVSMPLVSKVTTGMAVAFVLAPVWLPWLSTTPQGPALMGAGVLFIGGGFIVGWASRKDHLINMHVAITTATTYAMYLCGVGALVWAARSLSIRWVIFIFGAAWLMDSVMHPADWQDSAWKYGFAIPVTLIVVSLLDMQRSTGLKILGLLVLGAISATHDHRSGFATCIVASVVLGWQRLRQSAVREPSLTKFILGLLSVGYVIYYAVTRLLVSGALGESLRAKSEAQVEASGSLLLGGRPEWTVTIRLFRERPFGFGFGTVPSPTDIELGRRGFASIHLSSQVNYLEHYVFAAIFRLHSIAADLWATGGPAGMVLVLVMIWVLVKSMATELAFRTASVTQVMLTILALWDIGFSPSFTNFPDVMLALAVALVANRATAVRRRARMNLPTVGGHRPALPQRRGVPVGAGPATGRTPV
jgi:hypothetical protein